MQKLTLSCSHYALCRRQLVTGSVVLRVGVSLDMSGAWALLMTFMPRHTYPTEPVISYLQWYTKHTVLTTIYESSHFLIQLHKSLKCNMYYYCNVLHSQWVLIIGVQTPWRWWSSAETCGSKQEIVLLCILHVNMMVL
jgi:hypothetical protein